MSNKPLCAHLEDELSKVIDKFKDQGITCGEAIGVIECIKLGLWKEQIDDIEDSESYPI